MWIRRPEDNASWTLSHFDTQHIKVSHVSPRKIRTARNIYFVLLQVKAHSFVVVHLPKSHIAFGHGSSLAPLHSWIKHMKTTSRAPTPKMEQSIPSRPSFSTLGRLTSDLILPVVLPTISSIRFIQELLQLVNPKSIQRLKGANLRKCFVGNAFRCWTQSYQHRCPLSDLLTRLMHRCW